MAFFTLLGLLSCGTKFKNLTVEEFQGRLSSGESVQLLDVRTPQEYAEGHVQGAVNIDWLADGFVEAVQATIDPEKDVLIYCRRGRRSAEAADTLSKLGYKRIYNLQDGFNAWKNDNMPITVYDVERFGIVNTGDPMQADIFLITGAVNAQNAPVVKQIYDQMSDPKVVVAVGVCACTGGVFKEAYNVMGGADKVMPVDIYVPGCAARPQSIIDGVVAAVGLFKERYLQLKNKQPLSIGHLEGGEGS